MCELATFDAQYISNDKRAHLSNITDSFIYIFSDNANIVFPYNSVDNSLLTFPENQRQGLVPPKSDISTVFHNLHVYIHILSIHVFIYKHLHSISFFTKDFIIRLNK